MPNITDASSFAAFAKDLRVHQPILSIRLRARLKDATRPTVAAMQAEMPHPNSGGRRHIRFSDAPKNNGAAIVINGVAETFAEGQPERPKRYKHKVFGKWSASEKTIVDASDYVDRNWAALGPRAEADAESALDETIDALAGGK